MLSQFRFKKIHLSIFGVLCLYIILITCGCDNNDNGALANHNQTIPDSVDFVFDVKPILSDKCFKCHGPDKAKVEGNLQLHTKETAFASVSEDADLRHAIVPGNIDESTLIKRIYAEDPSDVMPPPESNLELSEQEKAILKKWIEQGAEWSEHWAFIPPKSPSIPKVKHSNWPSNEIDNFILSKLESIGLEPSPNSKKEKLIRRLSFDLRGIPPSVDEIDNFINDASSENYNAIIDGYLDSYAFAERMTNEWLDIARYADTHGYQDDLERTMWPWRDWVIHAFKKNMPIDDFITMQLAGDLMPDPSKEQIIATAFNRNHKITQEGGVISEEYRAEYVSDRTNTFGTAFLGLTFECAKCHDHKYDPISQKEYFELFSFFNNINEKGLIENYGDIPIPYIELSKEEIDQQLSFINNLDSLDKIPLMVMEELKSPRSTHILNRGLYDQPTEKVSPGVPSFGGERKGKQNNRLDLANWLFEEDNPLFARVMVNRIWAQLFEKGIVATTYDFGNQGALPSHPKLLDHLAIKFKDYNWDIRKIIKYIVNSSSYKQDSKLTDEMLKKDPSNKFLSRNNRTRLSAEMIRDHALSISGLMVDDIGGPSVKPYQPEGLWNEVAGEGSGPMSNYTQDTGNKNYRRSLYTFWKRTVPPPNMLLFDTPTRDFCTVQREHTSTPLQALVLLNDPQFLEASKALAQRAIHNVGEDPIQIISYIFRLATSRNASEEEIDQLHGLYKEELKLYEKNPAAAQAMLRYGNHPDSSETEELKLAAHTYIANTILNLDETIRKS